MREQHHSSNYRLTVRLELANRPGVFARVAALLATQKANLGAVDLVDANRDKMIREITFDVPGEAKAAKIVEHLKKIKNVRVLSVSDRVLQLHSNGKIEIHSKVPVLSRSQLSMVYTPGVARVCEAIAAHPEKVYSLTIKSNSVAIVTDGTAILGLGNLGPKAALPVMEGKAMLFKQFAGIDAWPICLDTQDENEIVRTVKLLAPVFGGVNLEDISAPRCFAIEERLKKELDIPVMHDDQHGTAVVILAALQNALKLVKKNLSDVRIVVSGIGAAGVACCQILLAAGARRILACNRKGVVFNPSEADLVRAQKDIFPFIHRDRPEGKLLEALNGADVFIGVSAGNLLKPADLKRMRKDRIVFAMANPDPEVDPDEAVRLCRVFATGRSDYPNQINNALAFPGIFRGALDVRAHSINEEMKMAASRAIAELIPSDQLSEEYIVPSIFDKRVVEAVSAAVREAACDTDAGHPRLCLIS